MIDFDELTATIVGVLEGEPAIARTPGALERIARIAAESVIATLDTLCTAIGVQPASAMDLDDPRHDANVIPDADAEDAARAAAALTTTIPCTAPIQRAVKRELFDGFTVDNGMVKLTPKARTFAHGGPVAQGTLDSELLVPLEGCSYTIPATHVQHMGAEWLAKLNSTEVEHA